MLHCESVFFWPDLLFVNRSTCQGRFTIYDKSFYCVHLILKEKYNIVLSLHHQSGACYGHFVTDILPKFCLIPNYFYTSFIFLLNKKPNQRRFVNEAYNILGIPDQNLLQLQDHAIYAQKAIFFETGECIFPNPFILNKFRFYVSVFFNLDHESSSKYIFFNRYLSHTKLHRRILNFDELYLLSEKNFNNIKFDLINDILNFSILQQAHSFNKYKFLFAVDGAALGNSFFMQKNTLIIEVLHSSIDCYTGFLNVAMSFNRFFIAARDANILYKKNSPNTFSASLFFKLINLGLQKLKHEKAKTNLFIFSSNISSI
ncbi:hypothetical protein M9Y10_036918 [Tritrichomonas musculus]|uniref:Glycosyltransferase 61 catalytic domain-containing protein n=1 Tax=Tritrichomonas musculus TaxID=1915356 RepID=A0ABR2GTB8_9EUKA